MSVKAKKVLVTGADGFIGSHLAEMLLDRGASVRAFVLYNSFNSWGWLDSIPKAALRDIEVVAGDVRDANSIREAVKGTDMVMHLAALIAIPFSYRAPESYLETNVRGTMNVLNAVREAECQRLLVTSTSEVYGTARYVPMNEDHPLQGQSPYSATKIGADRLAESYWRSFGTPVTIVRPFNTYGPRQSARAVIPAIITQLLAGKLEICLGSLTPTRDFNYVRDTCEGFVAIAEAAETVGEEINIASGSETSIGDLARELIRQLNPAARIVTDSPRLRPERSEVERLVGSSEKLRRMTGWMPRTALSEGLAHTIAWFQEGAYLKQYKPDLYGI